ncbi:hypothetical protein MD484_g8952, partial [Candolleomyces efflorescens]
MLEDRAVDIPPDFESLRFRAQGANGAFSFTTKILPQEQVPVFIPRLRQFLVENGVVWGRNLFVVHEIRGVKNSAYHPPDAQNAEYALDDFLDQHHINIHDIQSDLDENFSSRWFVDIGLEVSTPSKRCLAWISAEHQHLLSDLCGVDLETAARLTSPNGYRGYTRDIMAHCVDIAGFRLEPGNAGRGEFDLQYMQCYTTEKGLLDRKDGKLYSKKLTMANVIKGRHAEYLDRLYHTFIAASNENPSSARIENSLVTVHPTVYWGSRAYKTLAGHELLDWYRESPVDLQILKPSLSLAIGLVWWINALHSTYDDRNYSRELISTILPHRPREQVLSIQLPFRTSLDVEANQQDYAFPTVPCMPFGMIFFDRIRLGPGYPCPRMSDPILKPRISPDAWEFFLGVSLQDHILNVERSRLVGQRDQTRTKNKTVQRKRITPPDQPLPPVTFALNETNHAVLPPARDEGSDIEVDSENESLGEEEDGGINRALTEIWDHFLVDLVEISPNEKGASRPPWILLNEEERKATTIDLYRDHRLTRIFRDFMWLRADQNAWRQNFNRLFPKKSPGEAHRAQNYGKTCYWPMWIRLAERTSDETFRAARKEMWAKVKTLNWLPATESDRIWSTRKDKKFSMMNGGRMTAAPHILVYGRSPR